MRYPVLIGLMGRKGAGKDTAAGVLLEQDFRRVAFADPLKEALLEVDPLIPASNLREAPPLRLSVIVRCYGWDAAKRIYPEVRRLLQTYGVAIRDVVDSEAWVRIAEQKIADAHADGVSVVVTDVRFPNEAHLIRRLTGSLVRVDRPTMAADDEHVSETALDAYSPDFTVRNDGTVSDLRYAMLGVAAEVNANAPLVLF